MQNYTHRNGSQIALFVCFWMFVGICVRGQPRHADYAWVLNDNETKLEHVSMKT
jgi:hypothetical protein